MKVNSPSHSLTLTTPWLHRVAVRAGEHTLSTDPDCALSSAVPCSSPQDFQPEEVIVHPEFNKRVPVSDDIALIRLNRRVTLGREYQRSSLCHGEGRSVMEVFQVMICW